MTRKSRRSPVWGSRRWRLETSRPSLQLKVVKISIKLAMVRQVRLCNVCTVDLTIKRAACKAVVPRLPCIRKLEA